MNTVNFESTQEVRLTDSTTDREYIDNAAELYAVLNTLECLEKAFARDNLLPKVLKSF